MMKDKYRRKMIPTDTGPCKDPMGSSLIKSTVMYHRKDMHRNY